MLMRIANAISPTTILVAIGVVALSAVVALSVAFADMYRAFYGWEKFGRSERDFVRGVVLDPGHFVGWRKPGDNMCEIQVGGTSLRPTIRLRAVEPSANRLRVIREDLTVAVTFRGPSAPVGFEVLEHVTYPADTPERRGQPMDIFKRRCLDTLHGSVVDGLVKDTVRSFYAKASS